MDSNGTAKDIPDYLLSCTNRQHVDHDASMKVVLPGCSCQARCDGRLTQACGQGAIAAPLHGGLVHGNCRDELVRLPGSPDELHGGGFRKHGSLRLAAAQLQLAQPPLP